MSYTPTTWTTGDTITATAMNKIENGIANAGGAGSAVVQLSANGYTTMTNCYGYIVYGIYDEQNSRWVVAENDDTYWDGIYGFASDAPKIIPLYLTALSNDENVGLFFVVDGNPTSSVTGDITATTLYYSWGSQLPNTVYHITGDGSISLDNG